MILHSILLISSLSFAADGSKYEGKTGREAHESVNKSEKKTLDGGAPTPITPTNGEKSADKEEVKPNDKTEDVKTEEDAKSPETTPAKKKNKKKKNKKNAGKSEDNTMLFVGGGVLAIGAVIALLLGRKKEE